MEFNDSSFDTKVEMSVEDSHALDIMDRSVQLRDGHYHVALPWRNFPPWLSNNRSLAEHRLNQLKKRLLNDPGVHSKYSEFIDDPLKKRFARTVPENVIKYPKQPLWHLPHHPAFNPNKPEKIRVFDCAAQFYGVLLHSQLLHGPDLTVCLEF